MNFIRNVPNTPRSYRSCLRVFSPGTLLHSQDSPSTSSWPSGRRGERFFKKKFIICGSASSIRAATAAFMMYTSWKILSPTANTKTSVCLQHVRALRSLQKRISMHTCGLSQTLSNKEQRSTKRDLYCNKFLFTGKHESVPGGQMRGWRAFCFWQPGQSDVLDWREVSL